MQPWGRAFADVPTGHPYAEAIYDLAGRGIISGYDNGRFGPNDLVMRQQFAKMIVLAMGFVPTAQDSYDFHDVPHSASGLYPYHFVALAAHNGLIKGYDDGTFRPASPVSRMQVITVAVRAGGSALSLPPGGWEGSVSHSDTSHGESIQVAEYNGLLAGIQDLSDWDVAKSATRGEVAQILHSLLAKTGFRARVSVITYGARGDGIADDSPSIQKAIDAAAALGAEVYLPATPAGYLVREALTLKANMALRGEQSVLYQPSSSSYSNIVSVPSTGDGSNIEIRGLVFRSTNDRSRLQGYAGLGSNVLGIHLSNYRNVTIEDVAFENLEWGLKADTHGSQLTLLRARATGTPQPLYVSYCTGGYFSDLDFDRSGTPSGSGLWHHVYVSEGCSDLTFEHLRLTGGASWAFQIYVSDSSVQSIRNVTVRDIVLDDVGSGLVVCAGASHISFAGVTGDGIAADGSWFSVQSGEGVVTDVTFEDFKVSGGASLFSALATPGNGVGTVRIANGTVDGETTGPTVIPSNVDDLTVENVRFASISNLSDGTRTIYAGSSASYGHLLVQGCTFTYASADAEPISLRASGLADFRGNTFTVARRSACYVNNNVDAGTVTWTSDNVVAGFAGVKAPSDTQTVLMDTIPDAVTSTVAP